MKLKFLTLLSKETVDYASLLSGHLGLKKVRWYHTLYFIRTFKNISKELEVLRNLEVKKLEESPDCFIKRPSSIDNIAYGAMVELQILFQNPGTKEIDELITDSITLSCYESHTKNPFDSDSEDFKLFKSLVSEQDLVHMMGLYNWIDKDINASLAKWNKLFSDVKVFDKDWDDAGGDLMNKFDILNTIRKSCTNFNLSYHEVLKMPYGLIQASSFSDATRYFIQDRIKTAVESRMKAEREKHK